MSWQPASESEVRAGYAGAWSMDADRRAANLDRIRAALDAGEYEVAAQDVADAILGFYMRPSDSPEPDAALG